MCWCACSTTGIWSRVLDNEKRWVEVTDHGNELPEENAGCHKARQDKKWRNQKKSKPTRDSSRSDKKETSHVVWPHIKNVRGQTANQSTTLLYREDAAEVVHARSGSIIYKRTWIVYNWSWRKRWTSYVTDKNGDIVFQPHRHHWVDGRARRRRELFE